MIPVVFISDENFIMQTHVAIKSMIINKCKDTEYDIYVIMAECPEDKKEQLSVLQCADVNINFIEASLDEVREIKQMAHIPISCLLKFKICELVNTYDKLLYLDGDVIVRSDLTELYEIDLKDKYAAAVPSIENIYADSAKINAGVMLFNAKKMRMEKMADKLLAIRKTLGNRGSMDQQTFNMVLSGEIAEMPYEYNCIPDKIIGRERKQYPIDRLNKLYNTSFSDSEEMVRCAKIIHYATGEKPWKYKFVSCADEWYCYYMKTIYKNEKLRRDSKISAHFKGAIRVFREKGLSGVWMKIRSYTLDKHKVDEIKKNWG